MTLQTATYVGDSTYSVNCTGDVVKGDCLRFERATFYGSFRHAKFAGFEMITGEIITDSYSGRRKYKKQ